MLMNVNGNSLGIICQRSKVFAFRARCSFQRARHATPSTRGTATEKKGGSGEIQRPFCGERHSSEGVGCEGKGSGQDDSGGPHRMGGGALPGLNLLPCLLPLRSTAGRSVSRRAVM